MYMKPLIKKITGVLLSGLMLANTYTFVPPEADDVQITASAAEAMRNISTAELVRDMGIGINLGNTFEATVDWDAAENWIEKYGDGTPNAYETAWGSPTITKAMIKGYADEGFGVVRIPVAWSNMMKKDGTYTINSQYKARVREVIDWALDDGLYVIMNIHWDGGWLENLPKDHDNCINRFTTMWTQLCDEFQDYGDHLMFEAQNEELCWNDVWNPWSGTTNGKAEAFGYCNEVNQKFVDVVRSSGGNNPKRHLLISGYGTAVDHTCDSYFKMPNDPAGRCAVSVHYYNPSTFAILEEDADWGKCAYSWGTAAEKAELVQNMELLKKTFADKGIPVIIGEYGCPIKNKDPESVRLFLTSVCEEAYTRGLCPVLWDTPGGHYDREGTQKLNDRQLQANYKAIVGDKQTVDPGNNDDPVTDETYFHSTFESGSDDWTARGGASVKVSGDTAYKGSKSLYVSDRTASWNGATMELPSSFKAGSEYSFSVNVKYMDGPDTRDFKFTLEYKDASGETTWDKIAEGTTNAGQWMQLSNTNYKLPAGGSGFKLIVETTDDTLQSFYIDEAQAASAGTKIDGAGQPALKVVRPGDTDFDGMITSFDIAFERRVLLGTIKDSMTLKSADVDKSGKVEINDLVLLQNYVLGRITEFPVNKPANIWDDYVETATPQMLQFYQNSIYQMGNTARLVEKIEKAQAGEKVTVAYLGGSITEGGGRNDCYAKLSYNYFAETFGTGSNVSYVNAGLSGTSSVVGLLRANDDVYSKNPDVIFIEFSVNDKGWDICKKSFESLVKQALSQPNNPAVIILINRAQGGYSMQDQMVPVGKNFNVPVISMDNALTKAFDSGLLQKSDYYTDEYHPHAKGDKLISDCISYFYRQALKTENRSDSYTIPSTTVYGTEYATATNVPLSELSGLNTGSFTQKRINNRFPYGFEFNKNSANTPMTFKAQGKGVFILFTGNSNGSLGDLLVTVNGKTSTVSGTVQYAWGGPEANIAYITDKSGELDVSIKMKDASTNFQILGIGIVK